MFAALPLVSFFGQDTETKRKSKRVLSFKSEEKRHFGNIRTSLDQEVEERSKGYLEHFGDQHVECCCLSKINGAAQ